VVSYLQALNRVEMCARRLAPDHDCFADAVDDLGVVAAASRLRETFSVRRLRGVLEASGPVLRELAQRAERLGTGSDEDSKSSKPVARRRVWSEVAGLLLLMVATAISAQALRAAGVGGDWLQTGAAGFFVVLAAIALWLVWRRTD